MEESGVENAEEYARRFEDWRASGEMEPIDRFFLLA